MKYLIVLILNLNTLYIATAQQTLPVKEQRINALSKTFSVDKAKAAEIAIVLDYNMAKIRTVASNNTMTAKAKQKLIQQLEAERQVKIRALLTPEQYTVLQTRVTAQAPARRAAAEQHFQEHIKKIKEKDEEWKVKRESNQK